jgi:hypothetical protein
VKQDESAVDGFERISFLLIRYTLLERDLLDENPDHSTSLVWLINTLGTSSQSNQETRRTY